jgi:galactokinase
MKEQVIQEFQNRFNSLPKYLVRSPGRVNLIGEHTDYNNGWVLPMAINQSIWIALSPRQDQRVLLHSLDYPTPADFLLEGIEHKKGWSDYVQGMAWSLRELGFDLNGWQGVLASNIPIASGLSSSAALELAVARAFWALTRWEWDGAQMARAAKKMENDWLGLKSGIMDQMISACGQEKFALLIDCRDLATRLIPMPEGVSIIVMDTTVRRGLVDSAYNERVEQCQIAAAHFGAASLRDVSPEMFAAHSRGLDEVVYRRARHIITENQRVLDAVEAMQKGDIEMLGKLMDASHESLQYDYEVSCPELDLMVKIARSQPGCLGARMTGGGFGGCAISLIHSADKDGFINSVWQEYQKETSREGNIFPVQPSTGANLVSDS